MFAQEGRGILRVSAAGGQAEVLVAVELPASVQGPQLLPGGALLYSRCDEECRSWDTAQIVVERPGGARTTLVNGGSDPRYVPTGHLLYTLEGTVLAVPFDTDSLQVTGGPVPLVAGVELAGQTGEANADVARTGTLVYFPGGASAVRPMRLAWMDRQGRPEPLALEPGGYDAPSLSPDGRQVAMRIDEGNRSDIWVYDLGRGTLGRRTFAQPHEEHTYPVWTPDGGSLTLGQDGNPPRTIVQTSADGSGGVEILLPSDGSNTVVPTSWSSDGRHNGADFQLTLEAQPAQAIGRARRESAPASTPSLHWTGHGPRLRHRDGRGSSPVPARLTSLPPFDWRPSNRSRRISPEAE